MPVIKSADSPHASLRRAAFNFDDLKGQAEKYLDEVQAVRGQQLIEKARQDAADLRPRFEEEARHAGEQTVQQRVEELADALVSQRLQTLRPALEQAVRAIERLARRLDRRVGVPGIPLGRGDRRALFAAS